MGAFYFCKREYSFLPQPQTNLQYGASLGPGGADTLTEQSATSGKILMGTFPILTHSFTAHPVLPVTLLPPHL